MSFDLELTGRRALVTAGTKGIGAAVVEVLHNAGATVVATARAIPTISQKMLIQQLRQLERDGIVARIVHAQVPPKVEYHLTNWGQSLCPALDELLTWAERQPSSLSGSQGVKTDRG